jgi:quinol monooxygenase YgiN
MPDTDLHVVAEIVAKAGSEDAVRDIFVPFAQGVPHEPGCKQYQLMESHTQPGHFITVEVWADQASLDAHMKTPEIAAAIPKLQPLLAKPLVITPLKALT